MAASVPEPCRKNNGSSQQRELDQPLPFDPLAYRRWVFLDSPRQHSKALAPVAAFSRRFEDPFRGQGDAKIPFTFMPAAPRWINHPSILVNRPSMWNQIAHNGTSYPLAIAKRWIPLHQDGRVSETRSLLHLAIAFGKWLERPFLHVPQQGRGHKTFCLIHGPDWPFLRLHTHSLSEGRGAPVQCGPWRLTNMKKKRRSSRC